MFRGLIDLFALRAIVAGGVSARRYIALTREIAVGNLVDVVGILSEFTSVTLLSNSVVT